MAGIAGRATGDAGLSVAGVVVATRAIPWIALALAVAGCVHFVHWDRPGMPAEDYVRDDDQCRQGRAMGTDEGTRAYMRCMESRGYEPRR